MEKGNCIAWIRNSVDDAIRIYRQLQLSKVVATENLLLFHSRFAFHDRQRIESQTLNLFGKQSGAQRAGKVIIATQVIEQSLDIDCDEMISDLAPVDLLIQRAGRLQRHIRDRNGLVKRLGRMSERRQCCAFLLRSGMTRRERTGYPAPCVTAPMSIPIMGACG